MALRQGGQALDLDRAALCRRFPQATGTVLVMLHGLCMNDLQWLRDGHDHGAALAPLLGAEPLYLNYNSGLPLAENGRQFAALMAQLLAAWPVPVERLVLLAHSMGGLVARSALQQAGDAGQAWQQLVSDLVCLGTPHLGAALERAGHGLDLLLDATPYAGPLARLGRMRSAGITDLRHGLRQPDGQPSPLPTGPRCWAVAAVLDDEPAALKNRLLGDGLVSLDSALACHDRADGGPGPTPRRQHVVHGINHMQLLSSPEVAAQLRQWLHQADSEAA
jgi:pimeloyl-ACP methyl ester carboxylesterase